MKREPRPSVPTLESLCLGYLDLKSELVERGFAWEIDWQASVLNMPIDETTFLRESAWVVLCSGMRESIVRAHFRAISKAFFGWQDASMIVDRKDLCRNRALRVFNSRRKMEAIISIAAVVVEAGFEQVGRKLVADDAAAYLQTLPQIGPVTALHLLKNLGRSIVKPDRHLARLSEQFGYEEPAEFCGRISEIVGDPVAVVDIVLWRAAALKIPYPVVAAKRSTN